MSDIPFIGAASVDHLLSWKGVCDAMIEGHRLDRGDLEDILFRHGEDALLNRAAWIRGLGIAVKSATIFPGNEARVPPLPNVHALVSLFDDQTGVPVSLLDGTLVTKWKTAGDSVLGASLLARPESRVLLIIGAGTVARSLAEAYPALFPGLEKVLIWNRTSQKARDLARHMNRGGDRFEAVEDLASAVAEADIVSSSTMSTEPVIRGEWVTPGTHVDLIGAFRPDMREADNVLIRSSELFVDSRDTAIHDTGELGIPIRDGVITEQQVRADLYDLCNGAPGRTSAEAITVYKNAGGAHLDLMTARFIYSKYPGP